MSALPAWYVNACFVDPAGAGRCPCQWGPCGNCSQLGKHDNCYTRVDQHGRPPGQPLTRIVSRRGAGVAAVWSKWGRPCRWVCACNCPITPVPAPVQLDLFAVSGNEKRPAPGSCGSGPDRSR